MSGINGKKTILIGKEIGLIPLLALNLERLETGRINSFKKILDGMMFCGKQDKHQVL